MNISNPILLLSDKATSFLCHSHLAVPTFSPFSLPSPHLYLHQHLLLRPHVPLFLLLFYAMSLKPSNFKPLFLHSTISITLLQWPILLLYASSFSLSSSFAVRVSNWCWSLISTYWIYITFFFILFLYVLLRGKRRLKFLIFWSSSVSVSRNPCGIFVSWKRGHWNDIIPRTKQGDVISYSNFCHGP